MVTALKKFQNAAKTWSSSEDETEPLVKEFRQQWNQLVQSRTPEIPDRKKTKKSQEIQKD